MESEQLAQLVPFIEDALFGGSYPSCFHKYSTRAFVKEMEGVK